MLVLWGWVHWDCLQPGRKAGSSFFASRQSFLNSFATITYKMEVSKWQRVGQLYLVSAQCGREGTLLILASTNISWGWGSQGNCAYNWGYCTFTKGSYCLFWLCLMGKCLISKISFCLWFFYMREMLNWSDLDSVRYLHPIELTKGSKVVREYLIPYI